ncbi:hypothetical protein IWC96_05280 [Brevundimonas sp. BAL450]|uniref:hypothetical protein n=1 Tax=Brevundimonas sp. BAL450 TaxID=1708162 RepID=UPI0018CB6B10|nr:hypothetical protein [Brevundimonas sp. BAL450]MBG7614694.1 hypothetical protein [Brevundimonas sp. BAL450]
MSAKDCDSYRATGRMRRDGQRRRVEISGDLFARVVEAREGLGHILDIEEAYEAMLGNFIDFERGAMMRLASELVHPITTIEEFDAVRITMGRLLDNLLSSAFAFLEQSKDRLPKLGGRPLLKAFEKELEALKLRLPVLTVVHAIRNHAQHEGSSVSGLTTARRRLEEGEQVVVEQTLTVIFKRDALRRNREASKEARASLSALLNALTDSKGAIELGPLARSYVAALSEVLLLIRRLVAERQADWSQANREAMSLLDPQNELFARQVSRVRDGKVVARSEITVFNVERVERLQSRNRGLVSLPQARLKH